MASKGRTFSILPTLLLSLVFGTILGVLLLLIFGRHVTNTDTVSALNSGIPGTAVSRTVAATGSRGASNTAAVSTAAAGAASGNAGAEGAATTSGRTSSTPIEGEAASGSAGSQVSGTAGESGSGLSLEQTVTDTAFHGTGAEIYVQACQSCHMPGGKGAQGAGRYPALANNPKLSAAAYPISMVLFGNGGMPSFGHYMSDQQISDVVNYIRTDLNKSTDKVSADDVKKLRQPGQHYMIFGESAG